MFYDFGTPHDAKFGAQCHPNCDCGRFVEIGNSVFMEYKKREDGSFEKLAQQNVDFGGGLERITQASNGDPDIFHIDVFKKMAEVFTLDPALMETEEGVRKLRIVLDHMRAAIFLIGDGVLPANKGLCCQRQGIVLRWSELFRPAGRRTGQPRTPSGLCHPECKEKWATFRRKCTVIIKRAAGQ